MSGQLLTVSLLGALAAAGWVAGVPTDDPEVGQAAIPATLEAPVDAAAVAGPRTRAEGAQAVDSATAAALIGAISTHFGEQEVGVKIDRVALEPVNPRDRELTGEGWVRVGSEEDWLPIRFHALYDTQTTEVLSPVVELGSDATAFEAVSPRSDLVDSLDERLAAALDAEFPAQPVEWTSDQVRVAPVGSSLLRVLATGTADFDAEGLTAVRVDALYDRAAGQWVTVDYELGTAAKIVDETEQPRAVATSR